MPDGNVHEVTSSPHHLADMPSSRAALESAMAKHGVDTNQLIDMINKPTSDLTDSQATVLHDIRESIQNSVDPDA